MKWALHWPAKPPIVHNGIHSLNRIRLPSSFLGHNDQVCGGAISFPPFSYTMHNFNDHSAHTNLNLNMYKHSPEKCKRIVWQCNQKYKNEVHCTTPYLDEASVKERFTVAVNQLLAGRDAAIAAYELGMAKALDTTELEAQQQELLSEMEVLNGMIQQMIRHNATVAQNQTEYNKRFDALSQKFKEAEAKKDAVAQQISDILERRGMMEDFLRILKQQDGEVTTFSEKLWCGLLDYATAYTDGRLTFTFKNGSTFEG